MKSLARRARSKSPFRRRRRDALDLLEDVRRYEQDYLSGATTIPNTPISSPATLQATTIKCNSPPRLSLRNSPFRCSKKKLHDDEYHEPYTNNNNTDLDSTFTNSSCFGETREDEDDSFSPEKSKFPADDGDRVEVRFQDRQRTRRGRSHSPFRRRKTVGELIADATKIEYIPSKTAKSRADPPSTPSTPSSRRSLIRSLSPLRSPKKSNAAMSVVNYVAPVDSKYSPSSSLNISMDSDLLASSSPCTTRATTEGHCRGSRLPPRPTASAVQSAAVAPMLSVKLRPRSRKILNHLSVGYMPRNNNPSSKGGDVSVVEVVLGSPSPSVCNLNECNEHDDLESNDAKSLAKKSLIAMQKPVSFRNRFLKAPSSIRQQSSVRQPADPGSTVLTKTKQLASSRSHNGKKKKSSKCIVEFDLDEKQIGDVETIKNTDTKTPYSIKINESRRSHVSELSSPDVLPRKQSLAEESVAELRSALVKVQQEIERKRVSRDVVISTLQNLAETLGNSHDRELMKKELVRLTAGTDEKSIVVDTNDSEHSSIMDRRKESARVRREAAKYVGKYGLDRELCGALTDDEDQTEYDSDDNTGEESDGSFSQWYDEAEQNQSGTFNLFDILGLSKFLFAEEDFDDDVSVEETLPTPPRIKRQKDPEKTHSPDTTKNRPPMTADSPGRIRRREIRRQEIAAEEKMLRELEEEDRKIRQAQKAEYAKQGKKHIESPDKCSEEDNQDHHRKQQVEEDNRDHHRKKQVEFVEREEIIKGHDVVGTEDKINEKEMHDKIEENKNQHHSDGLREHQLSNSERNYPNLREKGKEIRRLRHIEARKRLKAKGIERNTLNSSRLNKCIDNLESAPGQTSGHRNSPTQVKVDNGEAFGKIIEEELRRQREAEKKFRELTQLHAAAYQARHLEEQKILVNHGSQRKKDPEGRKGSSPLNSSEETPVTAAAPQKTVRTRSLWNRQSENNTGATRGAKPSAIHSPSKTRKTIAFSQDLQNDEFSVGSIESQHFNQGLSNQVRSSDQVQREEQNRDKRPSKAHSSKATVEMPTSPPKVLYKYTTQDDEIPYVRRGRPDPYARRSKGRSKRL